jgi:hypothetical protein
MRARVLRIFLSVLMAATALLVPDGVSAQQKVTQTESPLEGFFVGFTAVYPTGFVSPAIVTEGDPGGGMVPMDFGYGLGVLFEYGTSFGLRPFADITVNRAQKQVARVGEYSSSEWVFEQTDYSSHEIGPFSEDAYYTMDTFGARVGAKLAFPIGNMIPWIGAGYGYYNWTVDYGTKDREGTWGSASGEVWGPTVLGGVMFNLFPNDPDPMLISLMVDAMSPVAYPIIENLFRDGWTWDNPGGNHVMGPYRFGVQIMM